MNDNMTTVKIEKRQSLFPTNNSAFHLTKIPQKTQENTEYDDKLKDAIKRSSTVSYLNEYSNFENLDENMKDNIYLKIFKQRFIYLYAMTKFKLGTEINSGNQTTNIGQNNIAGNANKNKSKKNKEKRNNYFKDAIKNFQDLIKNVGNIQLITVTDVKTCMIKIKEIKFKKTQKI